MDKLRSLELFLATCDGGSFAAAAKSCSSDPSTVSKAIGRLEAQLGLTLFQRSTRKLRITPAGERYAETVRSLIGDLTTCEDELKQINDSPSGTLRINSAVCYGHLYLRPILQSFVQKYPAINLELEIDDRYVDVIANNIDITVRTGYVEDSRLIARRLSPMDFLVCASPQYLEQNCTPRYAEEFHSHRWIGFRIKETQQLQPIYLPDEGGHYISLELERNHIADDGEAMAHMCADGLGIAQLPHFLAKKGLEDGSLVSLFPHFRAPQHNSGVYVIFPKREYLPAKVRVFIDYLVSSLSAARETASYTWAEEWPSLVSFNHRDVSE